MTDPYEAARRADVAAHRQMVDELRAADDRGDLTTHEPGEGCGLGWHVGPCPKES